jgi:hypothetical protein
VRALSKLDTRWFQLVFLSSFLLFGAMARDFSITCSQIGLTFVAGISSQMFWQFALKLPQRFTINAYLSALITCFGIAILVRSENLWVHPLLAALAMSSKYIVRFGRGENRGHIFNPANFAAVCALSVMHGAWLSQAQWGSGTLFSIWLIGLGGVVTGRIRRLDIGFAFLVSWACLLAARLVVLGYSWDPGAAMWLHQMSNGALALYDFRSDDDATTTGRTHRLCIPGRDWWIGALYWQFVLFKGNGLIVSLFLCSWLVPLFNQLWPAPRFAWYSPDTSPVSDNTAARVNAGLTEQGCDHAAMRGTVAHLATDTDQERGPKDLNVSHHLEARA